MSNSFIQDGTGRGFLARVDSSNHLEVRSVSSSEREFAVLAQQAFEVGFAPKAFTVATETAMIYIKNNQNDPLIIDRFEFSGAESTGGTSSVCLLKLYTGATGMTNSITDGSVNSYLGSAISLNATVAIGNGSTSTVTGGSPFGAAYIKYTGQSVFDGPWALPRGGTIAVTVTPPPSNTSLPLGLRILTHIVREE